MIFSFIVRLHYSFLRISSKESTWTSVISSRIEKMIQKILSPGSVLVFLTCLVANHKAIALQIGPLLSTCVDACQAGCAEIRAVQAKRNNGDNVDFQFKVEGDNRSALTEADTAAQRAIVGALRQTWGGQLRIVGEEDDDDEELAASLASNNFPILKKDLFEDDIGETPDIDIDEITIYVDPLDGTREVRNEWAVILAIGLRNNP